MMSSLHIITSEYPPIMGGVSEHSRIVAHAAAAEGYEVHVWTAAHGTESPNVFVRPALGDFSSASLQNVDAALNEWAPPRHLVVQWVPHGYGRKGLNVPFSRWVRRRALAGDRIDLIVHEPYMDFFGGSWLQPPAAVVQRLMTRTVVRCAERVWLTIPGWEPRINGARQKTQAAPQMLPVPGTIPLVQNASAVAAVRRILLQGRSRLIGTSDLAALIRSTFSRRRSPSLPTAGRMRRSSASAGAATRSRSRCDHPQTIHGCPWSEPARSPWIRCRCICRRAMRSCNPIRTG